ncbi:SAM-dependent methyltransferase [Clostridium sp. AN503]|uniref:class I SAM-dependent methyltransferase n=1 Tax=Clostridium sp. AN503 TaxID=3160598 RepID=UPI003459CDD3
MAKETLESMLDYFINQSLVQLILSNPTDKERILKVKLRPVMLKETLVYQAEEFVGAQAFHKNLMEDETKAYISERLARDFKQAELLSSLGNATVLVGKKGTMTVKAKRKLPQEGRDPSEGTRITASLSGALMHNRKKQYVLPEGIPVPFLVDLGVMTAEGAVVRTRYDKFRQINRFLEFIEDILPNLDKGRENTIIDFGCGKSYLTFAMYYYLHELKGYPIRIIGLDLKQDVINRCNRLAVQYGYDRLRFYHGDIATYEGVDQVDMVVTLHACDTATDYALAKAVRWNAKVILSVPCCQHELNRQMGNDLMKPVFQYGLIKERMAALYTDAVRAELLENQGYRTQILEFIDMEHTPKNILIRAVRDGKRKKNEAEIKALLDFLSVKPTLAELLWGSQEEQKTV